MKTPAHINKWVDALQKLRMEAEKKPSLWQRLFKGDELDISKQQYPEIELRSHGVTKDTFVKHLTWNEMRNIGYDLHFARQFGFTTNDLIAMKITNDHLLNDKHNLQLYNANADEKGKMVWDVCMCSSSNAVDRKAAIERWTAQELAHMGYTDELLRKHFAIDPQYDDNYTQFLGKHVAQPRTFTSGNNLVPTTSSEIIGTRFTGGDLDHLVVNFQSLLQ